MFQNPKPGASAVHQVPLFHAFAHARMLLGGGWLCWSVHIPREIWMVLGVRSTLVCNGYCLKPGVWGYFGAAVYVGMQWLLSKPPGIRTFWGRSTWQRRRKHEFSVVKWHSRCRCIASMPGNRSISRETYSNHCKGTCIGKQIK